MNSKLIDSKAKIVGLDEIYKPQAFLDVANFDILPFHKDLFSTLNILHQAL